LLRLLLHDTLRHPATTAGTNDIEPSERDIAMVFHLFTVRIDGMGMSPHIGDMLTPHMDAQHLHWFDAATQQRV
jgi:hypothetical protein